LKTPDQMLGRGFFFFGLRSLWGSKRPGTQTAKCGKDVCNTFARIKLQNFVSAKVRRRENVSPAVPSNLRPPVADRR